MKKNSFIKLSILPLISLLSIVSCNQGNGSSENVISVWSTYSTHKVIKQTYRNDSFINLGEKVQIQMMKDEYESGQIIVTSNQKKFIDIEVSPLIDDETNKTIPVDNIDIYFQKYITLEILKHTDNDEFFTSGDQVPDMLLPLKYAKSNNQNYVDANSNQGITIEINSYGLSAGHYSGSFLLKIGEETKDIPIEVTIWDFALEGKSAIQSCWLIYSMYMLTGEYDASRAMLNTYADFLSKYKANPYIIQNPEMNSPEALFQDVERMWSIKNYNSIIIPYDFPLDYNPNSYQGDTAAAFIVKLAEKSTEENFYLDYALFYPSTYDEADVVGAKKDASPEFFKVNGSYQKTLEKAIKILNDKGYFAKHDDAWNERVKKAIRAIPDVFTNCNYAEGWVKEFPATFCPKINAMNSQKIQEAYMDYAKRNANGNLWTYTCLSPNYPYASHHLDDDCLSMRVLGWIEKAYNVNGYLFFMANMYTTENDASRYTTPYIIADRNGGANGDGFIMYPGRAFGSPEPFPSMRLITYRDGLEDYDMLDIYERMIKEIADKYDISDINVKEYISDIYNSLFTDVIPTTDHHKLYKAREELANRILNFHNEDDYFATPKIENGQVNLYIYANKNNIKVNGIDVTTEASGTGYRYIYPLSISSETVTIKIGNNEYKYKNDGYRNLTNFTFNNNILVSEDSSFVNEGNGKVNFLVKSKEYEEITKTIKFTPYITFSNIDLRGIKKLVFNYSNTSETEDLLFDVDLLAVGKTKTVGGHFSIRGASKTFEINLEERNIDLSQYNSIRIRFSNYYSNDDDNIIVFNDRNVTFEDVIAKY